MNSIRFEINNKTIVRGLPASWDELERRHLLFVAPHVLFTKSNIQLRRQMALSMLRLHARLQKLMNISQLDELAESLCFLWKKNNLTKQMLPGVRCGLFSRLHGPSDRLENITAAEFAFAEKYMTAFAASRDEKQLDLFVACLYRPAAPKSQRKQYDIRVPFDINLIEHYAKKSSRISLAEKLAIYTFYQGCRNLITNKYKAVFSSENSKEAKKSNSGWLGFFYTMAGPKTGTFHQVAAMNIYDLLGILLTMIEQTNAEKARMQAAKNKTPKPKPRIRKR